MQTCPSFTFANSTNNSCDACTSPCLQCENDTNTCLSCVNGYTLNGTSCIIPVITSLRSNPVNLFYPWPFVACTFLLTIIVLLCILCKKETKFRESAIALVSWPEFLSWLTLAVYSYYVNGLTLFFVLIAGGIFV